MDAGKSGKSADGNVDRDAGTVKKAVGLNVVNLENYTIEQEVGGKWYRWEPRGFVGDSVKLSAEDISRLARLPIGKHLKIGGAV